MNTNQYRLAAAAGAFGLIWWQRTSNDTKQSVIGFLSQLPAALDEAARRRTLADSQSQITPVITESSADLLDEQSIDEILANQRRPANTEVAKRPAPELLAETTPIESIPDPETPWHKVVPHPSAVLILGKKGSGKSALAYRMLELFRFRADAYAIGLPDSAQGLLPNWIGTVDSLRELPIGSTAVVDEAHLRYNSRDSHSNDSRSISEALNLCGSVRTQRRGQNSIVPH